MHTQIISFFLLIFIFQQKINAQEKTMFNNEHISEIAENWIIEADSFYVNYGIINYPPRMILPNYFKFFKENMKVNIDLLTFINETFREEIHYDAVYIIEYYDHQPTTKLLINKKRRNYFQLLFDFPKVGWVILKKSNADFNLYSKHFNEQPIYDTCEEQRIPWRHVIVTRINFNTKKVEIKIQNYCSNSN